VVAAVESYPAAPRVVGRYVLYGEIASGGMASVHFGRLVGLAGFARPVAIKRLHAQFARDPDFVKMFLDEARLAARIQHPNVVPTLDVVSVDNEVFLVMEYVRGVTLAQLSRRMREGAERIPLRIALGIVSGMLQGLHAAHEARNDLGDPLDLVHRDVSPQNALVGTDGVTRLLDFGVAKAAGRLQTTRDGQLKGKLAYMAPEQVRSDQVSRRTDIYAASVVLWEVLTGQRLFYATNDANVLSNVLTAEVKSPSALVPELPSTLDEIALRGLQRDPAERYATAREMAGEIDACGVASPTEIGDWVQRTASEELKEHAMRIASTERVAAIAPESVSGGAAQQGDSTTVRPGRRTSDRPTQGWGKAEVRSRRPPGWVYAIVGGAVALAVIGAGVRLLQSSSAHGPAASASPPAPSVAPPSTPAAASVKGVEPPPALPTPVTVEDHTQPGSAAPAPSAAEGTARTRATATPPAGNATPQGHGAAAAAPRGDCNPPYAADAKGHIHFKPNCI
jgi:serine/threonine-protein kinase